MSFVPLQSIIQDNVLCRHERWSGMVWKKPYLSSECRAISKQTRNEWRDVDERTTYVPSLQYIFNMWTVSSDVSTQRRYWQPLSVHLWAYRTHPIATHDVNDVMCEGWPQHRGLRPPVFLNSGVGSFTSHMDQISVTAVRRDLRFFVLIRDY